MPARDLVYYLDDQPGITRRRRGRGFQFISADGTSIDAAIERKRLMALAVPPAYEDVWMSPLTNGHLQATGRDARKRKQYRYHEAWSAAQSETKFAQLPEFGERLPRIRRRIKRDLDADAGELVFALAAAVSLIDRTAIRVGNPAYTQENGSYGALTLRSKHLRLDGNRIRLNYTAKGGAKARKQVADRTLARVLQKVDDLPGAELLTWIDDAGTPQSLTSDRLNSYLADAAGTDTFTAKTFRTWAGTVAAFGIAEQGDATIKSIASAAAKRLHNTVTVARNSYIHPDVIALASTPALQSDTPRKAELSAVEARLLAFLDD